VMSRESVPHRSFQTTNWSVGRNEHIGRYPRAKYPTREPPAKLADAYNGPNESSETGKPGLKRIRGVLHPLRQRRISAKEGAIEHQLTARDGNEGRVGTR
jgi:hypothetical protein